MYGGFSVSLTACALQGRFAPVTRPLELHAEEVHRFSGLPRDVEPDPSIGSHRDRTRESRFSPDISGR
jgi:hypothetical protein